MKVCILYDSKYGTGKSCMEYLGSIIKEKGNDVDIYSVKEISPSSMPDTEIYIFSAPTHLGHVSGKMKGFLKKIENKEGKKYSVITTCMAPDKTQATENMENILREKGMIRASNSIKIKVKTIKGPAEESSKEQLKELAEELLKELG
ncbi:MAG: flavodoxin [Candidatus Methanofastidiosum methylothiophilum]|uniref:Flavodoxin n=1 Tax=Candidatus Methanofastidiosum methylothiophilum TaxID=1705564 RepID=A0A150IPB0_9EURY|nr:MAG: flavodoxin [Candidatus Methanofastidiosum methylthiophilus]